MRSRRRSNFPLKHTLRAPVNVEIIQISWLQDLKRLEAIEAVASGRKSGAEVARLSQIHRSTVSRMFAQAHLRNGDRTEGAFLDRAVPGGNMVPPLAGGSWSWRTAEEKGILARSRER